MFQKKIAFLVLFIGFYGLSLAQPSINPNKLKDSNPKNQTQNTNNPTVQKIANDCEDPSSTAILDINNVRTMILGGNDMWWDLNTSFYEIPKLNDPTKPRKSSLWAGSIWVGGTDAGGVLKVAAQTYRQSFGLAIGFWPGPLTQLKATTDELRCNRFNRHWKVNRREIETHINSTKEIAPNQYELAENYTPPKTFLEWPAESDIDWNHPGNELAPYVDVDGNEEYEPLKGDYPDIFGDQSIWFVTNDKGNVPGSGSTPIGMEIQTQAFAFVSNDEINNMTFYTNKIINRSSIRLDSCFMSQWVDPALGNGFDDYIACDVPRGLGIAFNGDDDDDGTLGYGQNPPSVGVDFFEGPFSDENDGIDNDRDCEVDEIDIFGCDTDPKTERMIMSKFMYFINGATFPLRDPANAVEAYNFMIGRWADGVPLTYGGNGRGGSIVAEMAFPGVSDGEIGWSTLGNCQNPQPGLPNWSESAAGNQPGDRRFVQSGGPFTLEPGAVNFITIGVVWARTSSGGPQGSLNLLLQADTKAQAIFENCFEILNGPDAPDLEITELDQELLISMAYRPNSNNYRFNYQEIDPLIKALNDADSTLGFDETYNFQGILLYQLANSEVTTGELDNLDRARLIFQCDLEDGIEKMVNYEFNPELNINIPEIKPEIANNQGITMSLKVDKDVFTGENLVNHRQYYFLAVSYGHNNYQKYNLQTKSGQAITYLAGRRNVKVNIAIPHKYEPEFNGLILKSNYGDGPEITKIEGLGNGGNQLDFTEKTIEEMLESPYFVQMPTYKGGAGPVNIKVINPISVLENDFRLAFYANEIGQDGNISDESRWYLTYNQNADTIFSDSTIVLGAEQILIDKDGENLGLSLQVKNLPNPGSEEGNNGFIAASIELEDETKNWLTFLSDEDVQGLESNWILAGPQNEGNLIPGDEEEIYETVLEGTWAPYRFTNWGNNNPAIVSGQRPLPSLTNDISKDLHSIDVVFTDDKSKWTRACVLEMSEDRLQSVNQQYKNRLRCQPSVDKNGMENARDATDVGMGWFPGYALDLETGERLNICFGEDSSDPNNNGRDLMWNPTDSTRVLPPFAGGIIQQWGGRHNIYIMKSRYDEGANYQKMLTKNFASPSSSKIQANTDVDLWNFYKDAMWVSMPALNTRSQLLETETKIRIRINRAYAKVLDDDLKITNPENFNNPLYAFNTANLSPVKNDTKTAQNALNLINMVPNPYYAYSDKESNQLDFRVKIINLPARCDITIYSLNGSLIKTLLKDDPSTSIVWNLTNQVGIPIAGGTYIVHIDAGNLGEKTIKWFGVLRPVDLDSF